MIRIRPVRVEDAEGVMRILNPLIQSGDYEKFFAFARANNTGALSFYKRIGFNVIRVAKQQAKISGKYIDEVMIERPI
jgi:ribosomal protein S18 acetylase RimI-like enzyme